MRIGIVGAGKIRGTLAAALGRAGHEVTVGVRAPEGRATTVADRVVADVGLRPVRVGGPEQIDVVDGVLPLWFALVSQHGGRRHLGFRTLGL